MKKLYLITTALLCISSVAHATLPTLYLKNQFGEQSINYITGGTGSVSGVCAANTIPSNLTSGSAATVCNTYAAVDAKLPTANGTLTATGANAEAVIAAGALSVSKLLSTVSNVTAGTYAVTLAAPSSQDGQLKIIKAVATMTHTVTLALTNVSMSGGYTPTGTTTLTFTSAGDSAVFMAVGGKWVYLGGSAVAS